MDGSIHIAEGAAGRTVTLSGAEYLFFSGTAYLGMHMNETFRRFLLQGLEKYGSAYGSSRASNLQLRIYGEAEQRLADWMGSENCILLSSGFMAGQLAARTFKALGLRLHYAPGAHPALTAWDSVDAADAAAGAALPEKNSGPPGNTSAQWKEWSENLLQKINAPGSGKHAVLACSIDPLRSVKYDFSFLEKVLPGKNVVLVIDDSHGFGVFGGEGEGLSGTFPRNIEVIVLGSLGKGLGIPAGAVWATSARTKPFTESPFYMGASPPAPAYLYAFLKAGSLYREATAQLKKNIAYFENLLQGFTGVRHERGLPVFFLEDDSIADRLMGRRIFLSSFPYPEAGSKRVTRIVLNSLHTRDDLDRLAEALLR